MYDRILAAIDDSEIAERVLEATQELAKLAGGEVWLVHVWEGEPSKYKSAAVVSYEDAHVLVKTAAARLAAGGVVVHAEVAANLYSYAAREIIRHAKLHDVGVIVMGSRGRSDLAGLLGGSTAHKVIHMTDRPVIIVR